MVHGIEIDVAYIIGIADEYHRCQAAEINYEDWCRKHTVVAYTVLCLLLSGI